jgi:hypothetical protein
MSGVWAPILAGFPNPVGWVIDKVSGFVGGVATAGFEALIGGLAAWVTDAVVWVIGGVFNFFIDSTDPNVQADWFVADDGPYGTTVAIGAALLLLFLLAGITQGVLTGDIAGMLRRFALDLPVSVLGMVGLVTVTQALIRLTDELSTFVLGTFEDNIADFTAVVTSLASLQGGAAAALVVVLLGLVTVLAGLILVAELAVRGALIYIVVALAPLVFAARLWPSLEGVAKKLLQLLVALILSKLAMAVALAVAASAAVGAGSGGEITALPPPEVFAEDPGGSVTQAVGGAARRGGGVRHLGVLAAAGVPAAAHGRSRGRRPGHPGHAAARRHPGCQPRLLRPGPDRDPARSPGPRRQRSDHGHARPTRVRSPTGGGPTRAGSRFATTGPRRGQRRRSTAGGLAAGTQPARPRARDWRPRSGAHRCAGGQCHGRAGGPCDGRRPGSPACAGARGSRVRRRAVCPSRGGARRRRAGRLGWGHIAAGRRRGTGGAGRSAAREGCRGRRGGAPSTRRRVDRTRPGRGR